MTRMSITRALAVAAMALALGTATPAQQPDSELDPALVKRWASMFAYLLDSFQRDRTSAIANIEGDYSTREIKVRVTSAREDVWVARTLTDHELRTSDLHALADTLYTAAKRKASVPPR